MKPEIRTDTWMPLYVSDYLADTSHLSTEEHGAYMLLLMHAWMNGGELPVDDNRLRRICRMDEKPWKSSKNEIKAFFYEREGVLRHHRVDKEIERAQQLVNQRSAAGKASAEKRKAEREAQRNGNDRSTSVATDEQREAQRNGKPSPSQLTVNPKTLKPEVQVSSTAQPSVDDSGAGNDTRMGFLCKTLRSIGIDSAPHLDAWREILPKFTDSEIITAAEVAREKKPGERLHLNYLLPILRDRAIPVARASPSRETRGKFDPAAYVNQPKNRKNEDEHAIDSTAQRVA